MDIKKYVTVSQAAEIMAKDVSQIARLCRQGKLAGAVKMGPNWVIPRASVENYTPGPKGFAAHPEKNPRRPAPIPPEWREKLKGV